MQVVLVRASDVPTYVAQGGADLGVVGLDTLIEHQAETGGNDLYQPIDLRIAQCRLSVAVRTDFDYVSAVKKGPRLLVANKLVYAAREFFAKIVVNVDLITHYRSCL